jgi:hypothetical protein
MLKGRDGILVYGGAAWTTTDIELTDEIAESTEKYVDACEVDYKAWGLDLTNMGDDDWTVAF